MPPSSPLDALDHSILEGILSSTAPKSCLLVTCTVEGLVSDSDLAEYCEGVAKGALPTPFKAADTDLQKLRARHHSVARLLASGLGEGLVATLTGFSGTRISQLKNSPAMQELIAHYRGPGMEAAQVLRESLQVLGHAGVEELQRRLKESPESLSASEIVAISKLGLDRSGHGPSSSLQVDASTRVIDEAEIIRLRQNMRVAEAGRVTRIAPPALPAPDEDSRDVDAA